MFRPRASALVLSLCTVPVASADVIFADAGTGPWVVERSGPGTVTGTTIATGGNPGAYRQVTLTTGTVAGDGTWGLHRYGNTLATRYVITDTGPITSIDFSIDYRGVSGAGTGQILYPAFRQAQIIYIAFTRPINTGQTNEWQTFTANGLTQADFGALGLTHVPADFVTGSPIRFGFVTGNISTGVASTSVVHYDNFRIRVVPAPGALALFAAAAPLALRRRR